jgi:hypothetical protein
MPLLQVVCAALYILRNNLSRLFYYILLGIHSPSLDFIIMLSNPLLIFQGIKGVYAILKGVISIYWNISSGTVLYMGQQISKPTRQKISDNLEYFVWNLYLHGETNIQANQPKNKRQ